MKNVKRVVRKSFFYLLSAGLLSYIVISIGPANIYHALSTTNLRMILVGLFISMVAIAIRVYKFRILLNNKDWNSLLEVFVSSRIGKEVSFAGYFVPLLKKDNRKDGTLQNLIIDRYTEILSTLLLAFLSFFFIPHKGSLTPFLFISIGGCTLVMLVIPFIRILKITTFERFKVMRNLLEFVHNLQARLKLNSRYILRIYVLSLLATSLDFVVSFCTFEALGTHVYFFFIPIVWASGALASMLSFMIVGSADISVIYLYYLLAGINKAVSATFNIIARLLNIAVLGFLFLYLLLTGQKKEYPAAVKINNNNNNNL